MKLIEKLRRKRKQAHWVVFNALQPLEFAECSVCGAEVEPDISYYPHAIYPEYCPECGARMMYQEAVD